MDLATGAMASLIPKLIELLKDEYNLQNSVKKDIEFLERELRSMHAALHKVAELPRDQLDGQVRLWAKDIRELSYDMEDVVDTFLVHEESFEPHVPNPDGLKGIMKKMGNFFKKGKSHHQIADAIKDIKDQVQEVAARRDRYKLDGIVANPGMTTTVDPRLLALYKDQKEFVGIEETRDELIKRLIDEDGDASKHQLKILSIFGSGGLGKTTLVKAVYDRLQAQFDCKAFIVVGRNPDVKKVFKDMILELGKDKYMYVNLAILDERQLINELRELLQNKRYFIIIDDIWDIKVWNTIACALRDSNHGSIIITTTRNVNVSKACCSSNGHMVYKMKPLSEDYSQRLFYKRIFESESGCPHELEGVSKEILKKCGGVPLAIITIASLLASNDQQIKGKDQWRALLNSIGRGIAEGGSMEDMQRILSFSYYDLPSHLKTCLLYLGVFPEDYVIRRQRLIWRWIAEGFVRGAQTDTNLFELGETYFNELINRSMIQAVDINAEGVAQACRVHDMVLDLICSLSSEENFVTILDGIERSAPSSQTKVRRLSIQKSMVDVTESQLATSMPHVRSFTIFSPASKQMLPFSSFQVLRVLDLEGCCSLKETNLKSVGNLSHLRYLGLRDVKMAKLPVEIGKLQFLQTLDLRGAGLTKLPSSVVQLRQLVSLYVDMVTKLPAGLGKLTCLEELNEVVMFYSPHIAEDLGHLAKLRVLVIHWGEQEESLDKALVKSLGKQRKLQYLEIHAGGGRKDLVLEGWVPPPQLRRFKALGEGFEFSTLPKWINSSLLPILSYLHISMDEVRQEDIEILGMLTALRELWLGTIYNIEKRGMETFVVPTDAFRLLRKCTFSQYVTVPSMFPRGVEYIGFKIRAWDIAGGELDLGMDLLLSLERVEVDLWCDKPGAWTSEAARALITAEKEEALIALRLAADAHPNRPNLLINILDREAEPGLILTGIGKRCRLGRRPVESSFNEPWVLQLCRRFFSFAVEFIRDPSAIFCFLVYLCLSVFLVLLWRHLRD